MTAAAAQGKELPEGSTAPGNNNIKEQPTRKRKPTDLKSPALPETDYKIVYRPQNGLHLAKWKDSDAAIAMSQAMNMPLRGFVNRITVRVQWTQNLLVISTAHEELINQLTAIRQLQVGPKVHNFTSYLKPLPDTSAGVVVGITDWLTNENIMEYIAAERHEIVSARRLGNSTAAVIHFKEPHVPFYVKVLGTIGRCRPYRKSIQYCKACGDIGHRQDVCPSPKPDVCTKFGTRTAAADHTCNPKCKLCNLAHETASKECKRRLKPAPPPLHVRQAWAQKRDNAPWSTPSSDRSLTSSKSSISSESLPLSILKATTNGSPTCLTSGRRSRSRSKSGTKRNSRSRLRSILRRDCSRGDEQNTNKVEFSDKHFPPLSSATSCTANYIKGGKDTPDWLAPFEALRRTMEENTRKTKELIKENVTTRR
ncbi:hypothetical protein HPB48_001824 [Haemaphysalis longicornis]|uniref:CCHC-type domain-containing protein n=1 Tax=Haemaphysalis longicornis TaxID=44386 RepID=A0A9J6G4D3_HAELO|nr:hypothetical protein HPB48_001824 [Haemaphysalis longicornis]